MVGANNTENYLESPGWRCWHFRSQYFVFIFIKNCASRPSPAVLEAYSLYLLKLEDEGFLALVCDSTLQHSTHFY